MRPVLVLALGNALAGDDAVGCVVAEAVAADAAVRACADVICAGTDLFRQAHQLAGRSRVIVVDAALSEDPTLTIRSLPHPPPAADRRVHAHALDPVGAVNLLRALSPELAATETWWLLIDVPQVALGSGLSPAMAAHVPEAVAALRALVLAPPSSPA